MSEVIDAKSYLGQWLTISIDRPLGSEHPKGFFVYPINYGFIPQTFAADGHEQDVYVLGVDEALIEYRGFCTAVIERHDDVEDKLVIVPDEAFAKNLADDMIVEAIAFVEQYFTISIIRS